MPDISLTNAIRELSQLLRASAGLPTSSGNSNILTTSTSIPNLGGFQQSSGGVWASPKDIKESMDNLGDTFEKTGKDLKKSNEDFIQQTASLGMRMAPIADGIQQYMKWTVFRPAELMGGGEGRAVRAGLERASGAGNIAFDIASALAAVSGNLPLAAGIQLAGRAGLATKAGQMLYGEEDLAERGFKQNILEDFGKKKMDTEAAAMFNVRSGRLGVQASAWGARFQVPEMIRGLVSDLNENPQVLQQAITNAFQIGGTAGIKNISKENISKLVREGYGDAATMIAVQATAGRYGYGKGEVPDLANRTGLAPSEVLPMMQQTRMQYYMFKQGTAESINKFVANTGVGAMNPSMGLSMVAQAAQGAAGVGDEATSMLQYRSFLEANPGSTYLDFVEAKRNGFADEKWRKFVGGAAQKYGSGGQAMRIAGGAILGGAAPGTLQKLGETYAEGMGPAVNRTGTRTPSSYEATAQQLGTLGVTALDLSLAGSEKVLRDLAGYIDDFVVNISKAADKVTAKSQAVAEHAATSKATPDLMPGSVRAWETFGGPGVSP